MKNFKENKGITLVSLVVTIVILFILSGVTINALVGDNGLINMAKMAKEKTEEATKKEQQQLASTFERNYATYNGQLHVDGVKLKNEHNEEIRLKGTVLLNNSNLDFNKEKLETLKSWGTNVIKVGLGNKSSSKPYTNEQQMQKMYQIIDDAIDLDMYVIVIFWSGNSLTDDIYNQATEYFTQITTRYKDVPNLIYEIANEPNCEWIETKIYANTIVPIIRQISPNAIILSPVIGHNAVDKCIGNTLDFNNIMYTSHIYAGEPYDCSKLSTAVLNGIPIFITEWSNSDGASNVSDKKDMRTNRFIALMDRYNLSSTFFIVCESDSRTFFIKQGKWQSDWKDNNLDKCGLYYKNFVTGKSINYSYTIEDYTMRNECNLDWNIYLWNEHYREKTTKIITKNDIELPSNVIRVWDISNGSGNIICYVVDNQDETYTAYIASYGNKIYASNGWRLFNKFPLAEHIDLSYLDTSNVENMQEWFCNNSQLKEIKGLNNFNTSNVTNMKNLFYGCSNLEEIDLSSFDFSNVTEATYMFYKVKSTTNVYVKNIEDARFIYDISSTLNIYYGSEGNWTKYEE